MINKLFITIYVILIFFVKKVYKLENQKYFQATHGCKISNLWCKHFTEGKTNNRNMSQMEERKRNRKGLKEGKGKAKGQAGQPKKLKEWNSKRAL